MRDYLVGGEFVMKGRGIGVLAAALIAALVLFSGGCSKQQVRTDEGVQAPPPVPVQEPVERDIEIGDEEPITSEPRVADETPIFSEGRTHAPMLPVYFDYDSSLIRADQRSRIERNAAFLKDNPHVRVRIEGNCDDRGTNEYNMALGERRAVSAKNYLVNLGIAQNRIAIISYGEEKPLSFGQNESSWAENRRDDFVIISN